MADDQPVFRVVDRRPFNPDGTPRELSQQEKDEADRAEKAAAVENAAAAAMGSQRETSAERPPRQERTPRPERSARQPEAAAGDPLEDPASFPSLIMSLASNAAANLGMMPHPATGETGIDLKAAKHWIDILGMLERKTAGNLDEQEELMLENLLADLRMQFVSFQNAPPPPAKFSATDITGGK